jgi:hypothetical protein
MYRKISVVLPIYNQDIYLDSHTFQPRLIGDTDAIAAYCHIECTNEINIGDKVLIAGKMYISDNFHGKISTESINKCSVFRNLFSKNLKQLGGKYGLERKCPSCSM